MANSDLTCPNCKAHIPVKIIALAGSTNGHGQLTEFEQTASSPGGSSSSRQGFWASEGATHVVTGLFAFGLVWLYTWWYGYSPLWAVASGLGAGLGLAVLRTVLYAPAAPAQPKAQTKVIQAELTINRKSRFVAVFALEERQLLHVAERIVKDGKPFSRRALCKPGTLSQPEYDKLRDEMAGRGWVDYDPENPNAGAKINRAGLSVLRAIFKDLSPV